LKHQAAVDIISEIIRAVPDCFRVLDSRGRTALYFAVDVGAPVEVIRVLLAAEPKASQYAVAKVTPLLLAIQKNATLSVIDELLRDVRSGRMKVGDVLSKALALGAPEEVLVAIEAASPGFKSAEEAGVSELEDILSRGGSIDEVKACLAALTVSQMTAGSNANICETRDPAILRRRSECIFIALRQRATTAVIFGGYKSLSTCECCCRAQE